MSSTVRLLGALLAAAFMHGCALQAPAYNPSIDNVEALKRASTKSAAVGSFTVKADTTGATSIGLRGNSMASPVGSDYAAYLAEALRQELLLAGKLDAKSDLAIGGQLLKNDIAAAGMSTNSGEIEARFVVTVAGQVRYEANHRAEASWESSFAGAVAIPKAQQQYPLLVQKLLGLLFADPRFLAAIR